MPNLGTFLTSRLATEATAATDQIAAAKAVVAGDAVDQAAMVTTIVNLEAAALRLTKLATTLRGLLDEA